MTAEKWFLRGAGLTAGAVWPVLFGHLAGSHSLAASAGLAFLGAVAAGHLVGAGAYLLRALVWPPDEG